MRRFIPLFFLAIWLPLSAVHADGVDGSNVSKTDVTKADATKKLEVALSRLAELKGFSCRFRQVVFFAGGGEQRYSGTLAIRRPGHFRWQYIAPYEQLYISDGGVIWHYEADLMQAARMKSLDALDPMAMKLLDGRIGVKDIKLLASEPLLSGGMIYRILIEGGPELVLAFSGMNELKWLESEDMLGNRNRIFLLDINRDVPSESFFVFVPPEGVEVVDMNGLVVDPD